jgi:hypothetical protein
MIVVFMHLACMGTHWREIAAEILGAIEASGLADAAARIHVGVSGSDSAAAELRERHAANTSISWHHHGEAFDAYEFPTLELLAESSRRHPEASVLYCHTKGVSRDAHNPFFRHWRRYMVRSIILEYRKHVAALATHDASGDMWTKGTHFSGNFWWARASHINQLPDIRALRTAPRVIYDSLPPEDNLRLQCEMWIGMRPGIRVKDHGITNMTPGFDFRIVGEPTAMPCPLNALGIGALYLTARAHVMSGQTSAALDREGFDPRTPVIHWPAPPRRGSQVFDLIGSPSLHRGLLRDAAARGYGAVCVMADDLVFENGFNEILAYALSQMPDNWRVIYLAYAERDGFHGYARRIKEAIAIPRAPRYVGAYLVRGNGLDRLADRPAGPSAYAIVPSLAQPAARA